MEGTAISIIVVVVGLVLFVLYLVYCKKKTPEEAVEEMMDYVSEHRDELLALTKEDLFEMSPEEIESLCGRLGLPINSDRAKLITEILDYVENLG